MAETSMTKRWNALREKYLEALLNAKPLKKKMECTRALALGDALAEHQGKRRAAIKQLKIGRAQFYRLWKQLLPLHKIFPDSYHEVGK